MIFTLFGRVHTRASSDISIAITNRVGGMTDRDTIDARRAPWLKMAGVGMATLAMLIAYHIALMAGSCQTHRELIDKTAPHYCPAVDGALNGYAVSIMLSALMTLLCVYGAVLAGDAPLCLRRMLQWEPGTDPITRGLVFQAVLFVLARMCYWAFADVDDVGTNRGAGIVSEHAIVLTLLAVARYLSK